MKLIQTGQGADLVSGQRAVVEPQVVDRPGERCTPGRRVRASLRVGHCPGLAGTRQDIRSALGCLAHRVGGALPAVSQHLAKLKLAGLVRSRREGRRQVYYIDDPDIVTLVRVMVGQLTARSQQNSVPVRRLRRQPVPGKPRH